MYDRELLDENIFFEIIKHSFSNPEYIDSKCILSRKLEVIDLYINQASSADKDDSLEDIYDTAQFIYLPMPFKKGDIVKKHCNPYCYSFRNNDNCVFIDYCPSGAEELRPQRDGVDIVFFSYYVTNKKFGQSIGDPFSYELEYATVDPKRYKDQKLILLSDFIKGKLEPDVFYSAVRYLESKENMADEKKLFLFLGCRFRV